MSLMLSATYKRADGATYVPLAFVDNHTAYVGEITDDKGTRRHAVPMNDHAEWTLAATVAPSVVVETVPITEAETIEFLGKRKKPPAR